MDSYSICSHVHESLLLTNTLSDIIRVREREGEHESVFETHVNILKSSRTRIEGVSVVRVLRARAGDILKDYVTKLTRITFEN